MAGLPGAAQLGRIERKVGPRDRDGQFRVLRITGSTTEGAGFTKPKPIVAAVVPGRSQYIGALGDGEKEAMGLIRGDGTYILTLKVRTEVLASDLLQEWALPAQRSRFYSAGMKATVIDENGCLYRCNTGGMTDSVDPIWPTDKGVTFDDGAVVWECLGPAPTFEVVKLMSPGFYGDLISTKVQAKLRQL